MLDFNAYTVPDGETIPFPIESIPTVQANCGNARPLLDLLGLCPDPADEAYGYLPVAEFAERVALAEALELTFARPAVSSGRWHELGAPVARSRGLLAELSELARAAGEIPGASIGWS